jgi:hypothetical protein
MKAQAKAQDALDFEIDRHPMWTPPAASEQDEMPKHIYALRREFAKRLTPFDGRPYSEFVVKFVADLWATTTTETAHKDPLWLIGQLVVQRHTMHERLQHFEKEGQPVNRIHYARERVAVGELGEHFIQAVVKAIR